MKVNLDKLWANVRKMGADIKELDLGILWGDFDSVLDDELSGNKGVTIDITELESTQGVLSYRGRQVLLFIPDHSYKGVQNVIKNPGDGNKFHVSDCWTLESMRKQQRFEDRYKVTNNLSGEFEIWGNTNYGIRDEGRARLNVCQNCLKKLNYKGATSISGSAFRLAKEFRIDEFFLTYSTLFRSLPKEIAENAKKGYTENWPEISQKIRKDAGYCCKSCRVDLSSVKRLLHVHHINGEKSDNSSGNLIVLCADCHRKEPHHGHVHVKRSDVLKINRYRKEQGLLDDVNWGKVLKYADSAVVGVIHYCRTKMRTPPEVGYELVDSTGRVCAEIELAWPTKKEGVYIGEKPQVHGWTFMSIEEALKYYGG